MANITERELLILKSKIDDAKSSLASLKGKLQYVNQQLSEEWGCSTIEEAYKKLKTMDKEIASLTIKIEKDTEELNEKYGEFLND
jgi:uncharacterized protein YaaN involved in tellurite resistance